VARLDQRLPTNVAGDFFVDGSCIACDTCRRVDPATFGGGEDDTSFVARQPTTAGERHRALMALVACPVSAIGTASKHGAEAAAAARAFPEPLAPGDDDVYACGYAAESSFGAASWLVVRPGGNVLVDAPRFARPLLARIRELGGVRWLFLTHRDDVADHARWAEALGCERVLHARDVTSGTRKVERQLEGDQPIVLEDDLLAIPVPGHTPGSTALLYTRRRGTSPRPTDLGADPMARDLFTGDHLWGDAAGRLGASRSVCWWDWGSQTRSMERLLDHRFQRVLPGHGRPWQAATAAAARAALVELVAAMQRRA